MIKLQMEDATLLTLDSALLPYVQWKSIRLSDLEGVDNEVLNTYLFKMSKPLIKSLIKNKRANPKNCTTEQWIEILEHAYYNEGWDILSDVQMPYNVIQDIVNNQIQLRRYGSRIARSQDAIPVVDALKLIDIGDLNKLLFNSLNPAIRHFMFTDEGIEIIKSRNFTKGLQYLTTEEFNKLGYSIKNRTISTKSLNRADACDAGMKYCRDVLRELNRDSITWDEAIQEIRTNTNLRKRSHLLTYMDWVYSRLSRLEEVK